MFSIDTFEEAIKSFYETTDLDVKAVERREFMFSHQSRHKAFPSVDALREYAIETAPVSITHSLARYFDPERREPYATKNMSPDEHVRWGMDDKGHAGIDIGFDIDYDHLPNIRSYRHGLEHAKENAKRLYFFLTKDLAIDPQYISIRFSGHRGYHMVVTDESLLSMGTAERANIENYVRGHEVHLVDSFMCPIIKEYGLTRKDSFNIVCILTMSPDGKACSRRLSLRWSTNTTPYRQMR